MGVHFASAQKTEGETTQWNPADAKRATEELMQEYGLASEHTTLLLLHEAVQFIDNDLDCPSNHPEYTEFQKLAKAKASRAMEDAAVAEKKVEAKLAGMMDGFVTKYKGLLKWKEKNPTLWGQSLTKSE